MFTVLVGLCGCVKENPRGADLKVGDTLPDFEVVMSDGTVVTDDLLKESVSVVMFFSTACGDCRETLPQMQKIYDEYASKGVRFALVSRSESESSLIHSGMQMTLQCLIRPRKTGLSMNSSPRKEYPGYIYAKRAESSGISIPTIPSLHMTF